jgi:hypothetical protein
MSQKHEKTGPDQTRRQQKARQGKKIKNKTIIRQYKTREPTCDKKDDVRQDKTR